MTKKLTFKEFEQAVSGRTIPIERLSDYLEFDPEAAVPKLRFRIDVLLDEPPAGYDVDRQIYRLFQEREEAESIEVDT